MDFFLDRIIGRAKAVGLPPVQPSAAAVAHYRCRVQSGR